MAFDFPYPYPAPGTIFAPPNGPSYQWDGEKWLLYVAPTPPPATKTALTRNRVINPNGRISQEGGAGLTNANGYFCDQWQVQNGTAAFQHVTTQIDGKLRLRGTNTVASLAANDYVMLRQPIEGLMLADLLWGQAAGLPTMLQFKISAAVAGTYSIAIQNGTVAPNPPTRSFTHSFALAANTPTLISVPVPPDLIGTWPINTAIGLWLVFTIVSGTTWHTADDVWTAGNFRAGPTITNNIAALNTVDVWDVGFHLDPDNTGRAPPYEERDYGDELALCQRYYQLLFGMYSGNVTSGATYYGTANWIVQPRPGPTLSGVNAGAACFPATAGTLVPTASGIYEIRTANASGAGIYDTSITVNARM